MRLLRADEDGNIVLAEFIGNNVPPYAILSHTWGADEEEVHFKDVIEGTGERKRGYEKIRFCEKQTANDLIQYFWVDTCCIDRSSSAELSEAINSMFRWYHDAAKCYVYLSDLSANSTAGGLVSSEQLLKQEFRSCKWLTRGWTLQELLAPAHVEFFSAEGDRLGDKLSLAQDIHEITGIPIEALHGRSMADFDIQERFSWAQGRETRREEDAVYSLLGIFDIHMPLIYGEGRQKAFVRLQREIKLLLDMGSLNLLSGTSSDAAKPEEASEPEFAATMPTRPGLVSHGISEYKKHYSMDREAQRVRFAAMPMWPGNIAHNSFSSVYIQQREMMSDAAFYGRWTEVLELLQIARHTYGENWANAVRLSE
jgi:hypothetical protein